MIAPDTFTDIFIGCAVIVVFGLFFFVAVKVVNADGKRDYCYMEQNGAISASYDVQEHVPWRFDRRIAIVSSVDEANVVAAKLGCELH